MLARGPGGWQVIGRALLLALPAMAGTMVATVPAAPRAVDPSAWPGLGYVPVFSMFVGLLFQLPRAGVGRIAGVGQPQMPQPLLGLLLAGSLLHEPVGPGMMASAAAVALCVGGAGRFA